MTTYKSLFIDRNSAVYLVPDHQTKVHTEKSKIGGSAPIFFEDDSDLEGYYYYLTIADPALTKVLGKDSAISVFIAKNFSPFDDHTEFPDLNIKCMQHPVSEYGATKIPSFPSIIETPLSLAGNDAAPYLIKIGGVPDFVQEEESFHNRLLDQGYGFLFQIDDNGLDEGILDGDYPFGYGSLFVYARFADGKIDDIVAGFTQF